MASDRNQSSGADEGYELIEGGDLWASIEANIGSIQRWDEMRMALDLQLHRDPRDTQFAEHLTATLWITRLSGPPQVGVLYEVSEVNRKVTYVVIVRDP